MGNRFSEIVLENSDVIVQKWMEEITSFKEVKYTTKISDELFKSTNREFVDIIFTSIKDKSTVAIFDEFAEKLINLGWPLSYITDGLQDFRGIATRFILSQSEEVDADYFLRLLKQADAWVEPIIQQLVDDYSGSWEHIVSLQRVALQELSAPLIPVMDKITIMPLVGTIDTERAKSIMENILEGVMAHKAEVVLVDITGVPVVDTMVAHHIIQAAEAVRLIGARCILVGIRPEIAQTIVSLGIDLSEFITKSSLQKGFKTALQITNRKIVDIEAGEEEIIDRVLHSLHKGGMT